MYYSHSMVQTQPPSSVVRPLMLILRNSGHIQSHAQRTYLPIKDKCRASLARMIALYRYIVQFNTFLTETAIKRLVLNLKKKQSSLQTKLSLTQIFNCPEKSIEQKAELQLKETLFQIFNQSRIFVAKRTGQRLPDILVNGLEIFFSFNADCRNLMDNDDSLCFSNQQIAKLFKLEVQQVKKIEDIYINNQEKVVSVPNFVVTDFMMLTFAIKLKKMITQRLKSGQSAMEVDIQRQQLQMMRYSLEKQARLDKTRDKMRFTLAHMQGENLAYCLKFNIWEAFINQLKFLAQQRLNEKETFEQLVLISKKYYMKYEISRRAFNKFSLMKDPKSIQERINTHKKVLNLFQYFKILHPKFGLKKITQLISKEMGINALSYITQYCQADIQRMVSKQQSIFLRLTMQMIRISVNRGEEVLFIDRCQFFKRQFVYYNLINNRFDLEYKWKAFGSGEELICRLILGVSAAGIRFYSINEDQIGTCDYLKEILKFLIQLDEELPKAVVFYYFIHFTQPQRAILIKIATFLKKKGVKFFYIPKYANVPNISKKVLTFIKNQALENISEHVQTPKFSLILKNLIKKYLKMLMFSPEIEKLIKKEFEPSFLNQ